MTPSETIAAQALAIRALRSELATRDAELARALRTAEDLARRLTLARVRKAWAPTVCV